MGCCISRPRGPNSPYPGTLGTSSARAINDSPATTGGAAGSSQQSGNDHESLASPPPPSGPRARRARHRDRDQPLAQHINKPLRRHEWSSRNRGWTRAALARERADFFDTRVTGRPEVWQTIRAALEVLWTADTVRAGGGSDAAARRPRRMTASKEGGRQSEAGDEEEEEVEEAEEGEGEGEQEGGGGEEGEVEGEAQGESQGPSEGDLTIALATAQSILTAADITLPTGDLAQGAYDATGNYYAMPEHVVSDPTNVASEAEEEEENSTIRDDAKADLTAGEETAGEELDDEEEAERRREEKGKAVLDIRDQVLLRARLSDGSQDVNISVGRSENVRSIARHIAEGASLPATKKIRIAYMGKILKESSPLLAQGWKQGHVVNALVFNR